VVGTWDYFVTPQGTPSNIVTVAAGQTWVPGTLTANQSSYYVFNDAPINLTANPMDPVNPRRDLVVVTIQDSNYSGTLNQAVPQIIAGTPASTPVDPAVPANSQSIARIRVPSGTGALQITAGMLDDLRVPVHLTGPHCRVWRNAAWSSASVVGAFVYDATSWDPLSSFSGGATYTCPVPGFYRVSARAGVYATASNQWFHIIAYQNGLLHSRGTFGASVAAGNEMDSVVDATLRCNAGDTIQVWQIASTAGLTGLAGSDQMFACIDIQP
jgi:hypothetical protein